MKDLKSYSALVFDCDGVILNSNGIKTDAFRNAAMPYGQDMAEQLVSYHTNHGGISRYQKFKHFLSNIVPKDHLGPTVAELLDSYAKNVKTKLLKCEVAPGLRELRAALPNQRWMVVSGSDQKELRNIFIARGLDELFDGGIYGSPDDKETILARELASGNLQSPALFLGDSKYDHIAATQAGLDFLFLTAWSEFPDFEAYITQHGLKAEHGLGGLLSKQ